MPIALRAALLAAWGTAYLQDDASLERAVGEVERDDEPHLWVGEPLAGPDELGEGLDELKVAGVSALRLALPAPGDPLGLTGPPQVNLVALAAGEAVVTVGGRPAAAAHSPNTARAIVPTITAFGTPGDEGHCVTWRAMAAVPTLPDVPTLTQADRDLTQAVREATSALASLDTQSWRSGSQVDASRLRDSGLGLRLPEHVSARADSLARRAVHVLTILQAARDEDGTTVSAHLAQARLASLAPLDRAARRAIVAAVSPDHQYAVRPSTAPVVPPR